MSENFKTHTLTIERQAITQAANGAAVAAYSTANRGALPKSLKARAIILSAKEKNDHGVRGERDGFKFLSLSDPQVGLLDRIRFTFRTGENERTVKVLAASYPRSANARFWKVVGEQDTTET